MREMDTQQFECLAGLLRSRSVSRACCMAVLVGGERQCDVARRFDVSPTLIAMSLKKYRTAYQKIKAAFGGLRIT